jgi:hypothetical protein
MLLPVCLIYHRRLKYPAHTPHAFSNSSPDLQLGLHASLGSQHLILGCGIRTTDIPNFPDPALRKHQPITSVIEVCFLPHPNYCRAAASSTTWKGTSTLRLPASALLSFSWSGCSLPRAGHRNHLFNSLFQSLPETWRCSSFTLSSKAKTKFCYRPSRPQERSSSVHQAKDTPAGIIARCNF